MKRIWLFLLTILFSSFGNAANAELKPRLVLDHLKVIQVQEKTGDELYFDISVYRANQSVHYLRVPAKPMHWPSQLMQNVSEVTLWSGPLKEGETVNLIVSLMESDASPFNPDDLLGLMRVSLKNMKGVLQTRWSMPNRYDSVGKAGAKRSGIQKFDMLGEGAHYDVYLSLTK
jgi:hypothetical protein